MTAVAVSSPRISTRARYRPADVGGFASLGHPDAHRAVLRALCDVALDSYVDHLVAQTLDHSLSPLDDGHRVIERRVEVEVVQLGQTAEPVGIDVDEVGTVARDRCTRAMTKVGDVTGPRTPRPTASPWVSVVLPAPSGPSAPRRHRRGRPARAEPRGHAWPRRRHLDDQLLRVTPRSRRATRSSRSIR